MKKKIITLTLAIIAICSCFCLLTSCTKINENLLSTTESGLIMYSNIDELSEDFTLSDEDLFSLTAVDSDDADTNYVLTIDTTDSSSSGYAKISQKVKLEANSYYTFTYKMEITKMTYTAGKGSDGVFFTIDEDADFNNKNSESELYQYNYHQESESEEEIYAYSFRSKSSGDATISLCVGTEDFPVKAKVNITSFSLQKVNKKDAVWQYNKDANIFETDYYGGKNILNVLYIVFGALCVAGIGIAGYIMFRRHMAITSGDLAQGYKNKFALTVEKNTLLSLALVFGIGGIIALIANICSAAVASGYTYTTMGYNLEGLTSQAIFIAKYGPQNLIRSIGGVYATDFGYTVMTVSSSPLQLYFLGFCGLFGRIFEGIGLEARYYATMFFIRFFLSVADLSTAYFIFILIKKYAGNIGAAVIATMYLAMPTVFAFSSVWGYTESITVLLIVVSVYFMLNNNYIPTALAFLGACLFSQTALFIAPMILFYTIIVCIKDVKQMEYKNLISACSILVLAFFVYYALMVPFDINYIQSGEPFYCFKAGWNELYTTAVYTLNAFNFQAMLGNNHTVITTASLVVTIIFILFMLALVGWAYFKYKNRMNLVLLMTAFINMMFVFANNMKPISMFISLALMLIYAIMNKEKRIFFSFVVFAMLMFINVSYTELLLSYTSTQIGYVAQKSAVMYVFASFELIFALYYVYIVYDIVAARKVRKIAPMNLTFIGSVKNFGLRIKKAYYKLRLKLARR